MKGISVDKLQRKNTFKREAMLCKEFIKKSNINMRYNEGTPFVAIVLSPWLGTSVAWFGIVLGMMLNYKYNKNIRYIVDDIWEVEQKPYKAERRQSKIIKSVLKEVQGIDWITLSGQKEDVLNDADLNTMEKLVYLQAIKESTSVISDKFYRSKKKWRIVIDKGYRRVKKFVMDNVIDSYIIPGGLYGIGGVFFEICKIYDKNVLTYDSGNGVLSLAWNGIAAHRNAIGLCWDLQWIKDKKQRICLEANQILMNRMNRKPERRGDVVVQNEEIRENLDGNLEFDILIVPNVERDTAALGCHSVFESDFEWISATLEHVIKNTNFTIAVREHPLQRMIDGKSIFSTLCATCIGSRVHIFFYNDKVNTYELIKKTKLVIMHTSTIGMEAAMLGKRVLTSAASFYDKASFVHKSLTKEDYFECISKPEIIPIPDKAAIEEASMYYYVAERLNNLDTIFTPQNINFVKWVRCSFQELLSDGNIEMLLETIAEKKNLPEVIIKHIQEKEMET